MLDIQSIFTFCALIDELDTMTLSKPSPNPNPSPALLIHNRKLNKLCTLVECMHLIIFLPTAKLTFPRFISVINF